MRHKKPKIAVIGGGVAGSTAALSLAHLNMEVTLFEKQKHLISGPPFCHLHAGGNLYPDISDEQCITLLKQSIDFLRFYPFIVDYRPTVIALPTSNPHRPHDLLPRLEKLTQTYETLILEDPKNEVLGKSEPYYQLYTKEQLHALKQKKPVTSPTNSDEWMVSVAQYLDFDTIQFPLILVQEYGLNLFRLAAGITLQAKTLPSLTLHTQSTVHTIEKTPTAQWKLHYTQNDKNYEASFDYLINAAGFRTGKVDDMVHAPCKSMVEFKAAYVTQWELPDSTPLPEIIFHGERGTPRGMGQFTPYPNGYVQLHGMTKEITLYEDGLVSNSTVSCQANLTKGFIKKLEHQWSQEETTQRTQAAIQHLAQFIPAFSSATVGSQPLFGAQQIPGDDPTLRVAEVSFPLPNYARCEIVKVSSVLDMVRAILSELQTLGYLDTIQVNSLSPLFSIVLQEEDIQTYAKQIAQERSYPSSLAKRIVSNNPSALA